MVHPDLMVKVSEAENMPLVEPVYPMTAGLMPKVLRKAVDGALARLPRFPEWLDAPMQQRQSLPSVEDAFRQLHDPRDGHDLDPQAPARRRLAYDEFLAGQVSLALVRQRLRKVAGRPIKVEGRIAEEIKAKLPFSLTNSQARAIAEINEDMAKDQRMLRLLQGDVGAGKTLVALMAMANAVEAGGQAVLMAPTEILARQHHSTISKLASAVGLGVELLTGRVKGRERCHRLQGSDAGGRGRTASVRRASAPAADGQRHLAAHAGHDRNAHPPHAGTGRVGDMDVSKLTEKPAGRKPIQTVTVPTERMDEIVARLRAALRDGKKAYWICPLVEESDASELMSAEERHATLTQALGPGIGLVHGRMNGQEKDAVMAAFKSGEIRLLVATTVVEVGVDVPDATIMVIEHAERFGLAQLHQLRGRVGRGAEASTCILLYKGPLSETGRARLSILRESEDGFLIAEEDLKLRGEGELLGTRQSGTAAFRIASLEAHADLLEIARKDAGYLL
ncbi:hypothetical protein Lal_00008694, partial [Lupinus albus]